MIIIVLKFYEAWRKVSPSSPKQSYIDDLQELINQQFENASNIYTIKKLNNSTGLYEDIIVRLDTPFELKQLSSRADDFRKVIFKDNSITTLIGDLYQFNNSYWICTDAGIIETPTNSCIIQRCTNTLNLYQNGNLPQSVPCIISKTISLKNNENQYITTIDNEFYLTVSNNSITQQINVNNVYKIGRYNYQITSVPDDISNVGLLIFKMKYSEIEQEIHTYQLTILNGDSLQIAQSQSLTIIVELKDNGVVVDSPTLLYSSSDENVATISTTGEVTILGLGTVTFNVSMASDNTVNDSIDVVILEDVVNNYTYTLISTSQPDTEIIINQTKTFTTRKYNNGSPVAQSFTFSVVGDVSAYQLTVIDGNNCSVKALKSGMVIELKAVDDSDNSKVVSKEIRLKNLF